MLFDLNNTRLNDLALSKLARALRKSIALKSLHLSGNPGINDNLISKIEKMLSAEKASTDIKKISPILE